MSGKIGSMQLDITAAYTGYRYDDILDVYFAKARMYDAGDKRFTARDLVKGSVGAPLTLAAYTYVLDNPLKWVDPRGLEIARVKINGEIIEANTSTIDGVVDMLNVFDKLARSDSKGNIIVYNYDTKKENSFKYSRSMSITSILNEAGIFKGKSGSVYYKTIYDSNYSYDVTTVKQTYTNALFPGDGSIGSKGTELIVDYERLGDGYEVYEGGKLIAILSRDVEGNGNITYGYGTLFNNTPEDKKRLKDTYGLDFAEKVSVSIDLSQRMYRDYVAKNITTLREFTRENEIWLNQNQMDALIMHRYLFYRLGENTRKLLIEMFGDSKNPNDPNLKSLYGDKLFNALIDDATDLYKENGEWKSKGHKEEYDKYIGGWTNRILDELELFFDGDNKRNH